MSEKNLTLRILGSLMKKPNFLSEVEKYFLTPEDFSNSFEKNIFNAIYNLYQNGANRITNSDIDDYLKSYPGAHSTFTNGNGIEFLNDCEELAEVENFNYYYNKFKKFNCLRDLEKMGYNTDHIYSNEITKEAKEINEKFENLSVGEILESFKKSISIVEHKYQNRYDNKEASAAEGIRELIQRLQVTPDVGLPLQGHITNTVTRGARKGKFYLRSGSSGSGKTRSLVGDACFLAYPIRYDSQQKAWVNLGGNEKVLYIVTEQEFEEIRTLILSYISDINEDKITTSSYTEEERNRINTAATIMEEYADNFQLAKMPDPNIAQVNAVTRKYYFEKGIENLFFDYIFSSPALLTEFRDLKIQEHVILNMISTALKNLASDLNIFVASATQVNRSEENDKTGMKNQSNIRGSLAIADKIDVGCIFDRTNPKEIEMLSDFIASTGIQPNQVADFYKVRRGRFVNIRVWSFFDYGTCRKRDLFATTANYNAVEDFEVFNIIINTRSEKVEYLLQNFNENLPKTLLSLPTPIPKMESITRKEVDYF